MDDDITVLAVPNNTTWIVTKEEAEEMFKNIANLILCGYFVFFNNCHKLFLHNP